MLSLLLLFLASALEVRLFPSISPTSSPTSLPLAPCLSSPASCALCVWIRPNTESSAQLLLSVKEPDSVERLQVILQNWEWVEVRTGQVKVVGRWAGGQWLRTVAYFTHTFQLCGAGESREMKCLDSTPIAKLSNCESCYIELASLVEFADIKLLVGEEHEIRSFYLPSSRDLGVSTLTSPDSQLLPAIHWTLPAPVPVLTVSGWFYLIDNAHILSLAGPNCPMCPESLSIDLYYSNAQVQVKRGDFVFYAGEAGEWVFLALGYAELRVELCTAGLSEATVCIEKEIDSEFVVERVFVNLEKRVTGADLRISTHSVPTYSQVNSAVQAKQAAYQPVRQLASTHYSALTYRAYMPRAYNYPVCNWHNGYYYWGWGRYWGSHYDCHTYTYKYFYYHMFVNNHIATTSISVYVTGVYLYVSINKYWNGQYRSVWSMAGYSSVGCVLYPANLANYGGMTGRYSVYVYGYDGNYYYEVSVRIACASASLAACNCAAGTYPNPYTTSCSGCGATDNYCKNYATLGCLSYAVATVQTGPTGFSCRRCAWSDQTLDTSTGVCVPCHSFCASCFGTGASQCASCKYGAVLTGAVGSSTCVCTTGYFANPTAASCYACSSSCLNCNNSSATSCTGCKANAQLTAGAPSACKCSNGYGGTADNCQPCHATCVTCQLTASYSCLTCKSNAVLAGAAPNTCLCQAGYYLNGSNCSICHSNCLTCSGSTASLCTSCKSNAYRVAGSPSACACLTGFYGTPATCTACNPTCYQCSSGGVAACTVCKVNAQLKPPAVIGPAACECKAGFVPSPTIANCVPCHPTCATCTGTISTKCTACKANAALPAAASEGACACSLHFHPSPTPANCVACHSTCYSCVGTANTHCSDCYPLASLLNGVNPNSCICDTGFAPTPAVSNCQPCDSTCKTCSSGLATHCTSCFKYARLSTPSLGRCDCIPGLYFNTTLSVCDKCDPNCLTCDGLLETDCLSCAVNETLLGDGSCTCTAPDCPICFSSCETCSGVGPGYCDSCYIWGILEPPTTPTFCECATSFYPSSISSCDPCNVRCKNCDSGAVSACIECFSNAILMGGVAPSSCLCLPGFYFPAGSGLCDLCDVSCATCEDNTVTGCLSCFASAKLSSGTVNSCVCLDGYFAQGSAAVCLSCDDTCYTCVGPTEDDCLSCFSHASRSIPGNTASSCVCSTRYFPNPDVVTCAICHSSCRNCSGNLITQCTECFPPNAHLENGVNPGQCVCNSDSFPNPSVTNCTLCHSNCLTCSAAGASACMICHSHAHTTSGPPGSCACDSTYQPMPGVDSCIQCDSTCLSCSAPGNVNCMSCWSYAELTVPPGPSECDCSAAHYPGPTVASCASCFATCQECVGPGELECTLCYLNASLSGSSPANCECDSGFYRSSPKVCSSCDISCLTCSSGGANSCTSCFPFADLLGDPPTSCVCWNNYFPLPDSAHCIICDSTCQSCVGIGPLMCSECFADASIVGGAAVGACECNLLFFPNTTIANCSPCHSTCFACVGGEIEDCTACFLPAIILEGAPIGPCDCPDGYYPAPTPETCGICHSTCRKCVGVEALECTHCYTNATVDSGFPVYRCVCELGFYPNPSPDLCAPCHETCEGCVGSQNFDCTSCLSFAKLVLKSSSTGICLCQDDAFPSPDSAHCNQCHPSCLSCINASTTACLTCPNTSTLAGPRPNSCHCISGFFPSPTPADCQPCNPQCATCSNPVECLSCHENAALRNGFCECIEGYMLSAVESFCQLCPSDCQKCFELGCERCYTSYLLYEGMCVSTCPTDYAPTLSGTCEIAVSPQVNLSANADNDLLLEFDKAMNFTSVSTSDISISVNDPEQKAVAVVWSSLIPQDNNRFFINLTLDTSYLNPGTDAVLIFYDLSKVVDMQGIPITTASLTCQLNPFGSAPPPPSALAAPLAASTQATAKGTAAGGLSLALINGNPGMLTSMVNQMQLMSYIGMTKLKFPSDFAATLSGLNMGFSIPLPFSASVKPQDSSQSPPQYLSDYGISSLQFLRNAYVLLTISALILLSYLPMYLLSKLPIPFISSYFASKVPSFRWSTPLNLWFTSYLDLGIYSFLQISNATASLNTPVDALSLVAAGIFGLAVLATPLMIVYFINQHQELVLTRSDASFNKTWSALFGEFNAEKGHSAVLYYYLFTTRRAFFFLALTLASDSPLFIGLSSSFLSAASLVYLLSIRPFARFMDQLTAIFNEASIFLVYIAAASFNFSLGTDLATLASAMGMWTARISIFGNMGISIYRTVQMVIDIVKAYARTVKVSAHPTVKSLSKPKLRWF